MGVYAQMIGFDAIVRVLRMAAPKLTKYGGDAGGDFNRMRAMLNDDDLVERIAHGIWNADRAFEVATKAAAPAMEAARKIRSEEYDRLVADALQHKPTGGE